MYYLNKNSSAWFKIAYFYTINFMKENQIPFYLAFLPILVLIILLSLNVYVYEDNATYGPNQIALLFASFIGILIGMRYGFTWEALRDKMFSSIGSAMGAIIILLIIGALSGTWMLSGVVPTMIYYGLEVLHPSYFLVASCIICAVVSLATGSSWSTIATVGVALLGIGTVMDMNLGMVAGSIISGAYFGDKMSPLSDTTNLAPAMAGTDLISHIRYMLITTVPTFLVALVLFGILGFTHNTEFDNSSVVVMQDSIKETFNISPLLLLVPVMVFFMIYKKIEAIPALFLGTLLGAVVAVFAQPDLLARLGEGSSSWEAKYSVIVNSMFGETAISTGNETMDNLLVSRGMSGMMNTIWLVLCAMSFGGVMEGTGMLKSLTGFMVKRVKSTGSLISTTAGTCVFFNVTASDQYLAIVVPGKMYSEEFKNRNLAPENLSRTLEDSGTVTSVLVPWNTCGAAQSSVLNVATGTYWMYCFFNLISPITTILVAYLGFKIKKLSKA